VSTTRTYKQDVFETIRKRNWVPSEVIKGVGGTDGLRRLGELREDGCEIKTRKTQNGTHEYRLISRPYGYEGYLA
jgi:hypothetical protein